MKILILGSDYNWSLENFYKIELLKLGHDVTHIPIQNWFYEYYNKNLFHKILCRLGFSVIYNEIQIKLLSEISDIKYDIIWVFKGMEIQTETLMKLKNHTNRLINFNPDNPFVFSGRGSGNRNVTNGISFYNEHFSYDEDVCFKINSKFSVKCTLVPFGFNSDVISEEELNNIKEIIAVCFIGNPDAYRVKILNSVLNKGLPLHVYGHGWASFIKHKHLTLYEPVYGKEYYQVLRKYRVQLNIMRIHNTDSHNMRSMEIPGCGGIMLAPNTKDHMRFFEEDKEVFLYNDISDLISKSKYILELSKYDSDKIRLSARLKVCNKFSYSELTKIFIQN
jgi:hypothetical protein